MASEFVRRLQDVFQTNDDAVEQYQDMIRKMLAFTCVASVTNFVREFEFDADKVQSHIISDAKFVEISTLSQLVLGKSTHYNQSKHYYIVQGNSILATLAQMRYILERIYPHAHHVKFVKLDHLAWTFQVFHQYLDYKDKCAANGAQAQDYINEIEYLIEGTRSDLTLSQLNSVLAKFLLQQQFLFSRIFGQKMPLSQLINVFFKTSKGLEVHFDSNSSFDTFAFGCQAFEPVFDFTEMVQTYLCDSGQDANIAAASSVIRWLRDVDEISTRLAARSGFALQQQLSMLLRRDLHHYLMNTNIISEPEMFAVLFCFMFNHDAVWFQGDEVVRYLELETRQLAALLEHQLAVQGDDFEDECSQFAEQLRKTACDDRLRLFTEKRVAFKQEISSMELVQWLKQRFHNCCLDGKRMFSNIFNLIYTIYAFIQPEDDQNPISIRQYAESGQEDTRTLLTESLQPLEP